MLLGWPLYISLPFLQYTFCGIAKNTQNGCLMIFESIYHMQLPTESIATNMVKRNGSLNLSFLLKRTVNTKTFKSAPVLKRVHMWIMADFWTGPNFTEQNKLWSTRIMAFDKSSYMGSKDAYLSTLLHPKLDEKIVLGCCFNLFRTYGMGQGRKNLDQGPVFCCTHFIFRKHKKAVYTCGVFTYYVVQASLHTSTFFSWSHFYFIVHANKCHENYICMQLMRGLHVTSSYISSFLSSILSSKCFLKAHSAYV